jgi:hypothetical protein
MCLIVKHRDASPSRAPNLQNTQAEGHDATVDRASTPVFGECLRGATED